MDQPIRVYTPGEAANALGVTTQSLRRYVQAYSQVFDEVPQRAGQRVFDDEIVGRLTSARVLQHANKAPSFKAALELVRDGGASSALERLEQPTFEQAVLDRLQRLTEAVERLQADNRLLHDQLKALEPPREDEKAKYIAEMEAVQADLERRNKYLLGELERRRVEADQPKRRRWWKWWGKPV